MKALPSDDLTMSALYYNGRRKDPNPGDRCVVTGWGRREDGQTTEQLQQVTVEVVKFETCKDPNHYNGTLDFTMLCAGEEGKDACQVRWVTRATAITAYV